MLQPFYMINDEIKPLIEIHIADLHFNAFDPKMQYEILTQQFTSLLYKLPKIDIICINGDLFDKKMMSNSDGVMYCSLFINDLVNLCRIKNATLVLLHGTYSHDSDQLKLFRHYTTNHNVDVRVITSIKFEYKKRKRYLCIPE